MIATAREHGAGWTKANKGSTTTRGTVTQNGLAAQARTCWTLDFPQFDGSIIHRCDKVEREGNQIFINMFFWKNYKYVTPFAFI